LHTESVRSIPGAGMGDSTEIPVKTPDGWMPLVSCLLDILSAEARPRAGTLIGVTVLFRHTPVVCPIDIYEIRR
jgi:hypothetical protein